jgi:hypothetical protein
MIGGWQPKTTLTESVDIWTVWHVGAGIDRDRPSVRARESGAAAVRNARTAGPAAPGIASAPLLAGDTLGTDAAQVSADVAARMRTGTTQAGRRPLVELGDVGAVRRVATAGGCVKQPRMFISVDLLKPSRAISSRTTSARRSICSRSGRRLLPICCWGVPPTPIAHLLLPKNRQNFPGLPSERDIGFEPTTFSLGKGKQPFRAVTGRAK